MDTRIIELRSGIKIHLIFETIFGSRMYGLATPTSDTDYKGIFLPTPEQCFIGKIPASIKDSTVGENDSCGKDDVEREYYSLHHFLKLSYQAQTVSLDMLFGPAQCRTYQSKIMNFIFENRDKFISKNLTSLMGYAKGQALKYSNKGDTLAGLEYLSSRLINFDENIKLAGFSDILNRAVSKYPNIYSIKAFEETRRNRIVFYVGDTEFDLEMQLFNLLDSLGSKINRYGERAKKAKIAGGADYKALSHALRCIYVAQDIAKKGTFSYPLDQSDFIYTVKTGNIDYDEVINIIDKEYDLAKNLIANSSLPDNAEKDIFVDYLISVYRDWCKE
jgi:hypothetical protein